MPIVNLLAQAATFVTPAGEILAALPPSGQVARAVSEITTAGRLDLHGLGVCDHAAMVQLSAYAPPARVEGLPDDPAVPILVPAVVADAMRALGLRRAGAVYSQMLLVYRDGKPIGAPGLILHEDLACA